MSVRCSFDGGKYFNKVQRGSFEYSCYGAALSIQNGPQWPISLWDKATGREAGLVLKDMHAHAWVHNSVLTHYAMYTAVYYNKYM